MRFPVGRTVGENATLLSTSGDLGRTWKPWTDIARQIGVIQQPNLVSNVYTYVFRVTD